VAITAVITDLSLRRHVTLEWDAQPLYQRTDASIGEPPAGLGPQQPGRRWARVHRHRFEALRYLSWRTPLPPTGRFK
jgi:hypothetical protein